MCIETVISIYFAPVICYIMWIILGTYLDTCFMWFFVMIYASKIMTLDTHVLHVAYKKHTFLILVLGDKLLFFLSVIYVKCIFLCIPLNNQNIIDFCEHAIILCVSCGVMQKIVISYR